MEKLAEGSRRCVFCRVMGKRLQKIARDEAICFTADRSENREKCQNVKPFDAQNCKKTGEYTASMIELLPLC